MKDFRQLQVWEKSHRPALAVCQTTKEFRKEEPSGLTSQMTKADYKQLDADVTEVKRMLTSLLKTLRADR